jgi:hypothetical protein
MTPLLKLIRQTTAKAGLPLGLGGVSRLQSYFAAFSLKFDSSIRRKSQICFARISVSWPGSNLELEGVNSLISDTDEDWEDTLGTESVLLEEG